MTPARPLAVQAACLIAPLLRTASTTVEATASATALTPFLRGVNFTQLFFFEVDKPFLFRQCSHPIPAIADWQYELRACDGLGFREASLPFAMTLVCPTC